MNRQGYHRAMPLLDWPNLHFARDLGGVRTIDDGQIRERALIRTDTHSRFDAAGLAAIRAYGVSRIVDLRWQREAADDPSPLVSDPCYRLVPACFDPTGNEEIPPDSYRLMIDASRDRLASAFTAIAQAPPGAVVVHCHAGRDRTGVVTALALAVAGASIEDIAADYALSDADPSIIVNTFTHLDAQYGGVIDYLIGSGVSPDHLATVRARLT